MPDRPDPPTLPIRGDVGSHPLEYRLLGPLDVLLDGEVIDLGVYKQRALLALLLINANRVVSTDQIIDELWPDNTEGDKQNTLWVNVSRLRSALEPDREKRTEGSILLTRSPGYVLTVDPQAIDAGRFELLVREGRALLDTDPAAASVVLGEALALWRGHPLEEFTYEAFAQIEIARLSELRLGAVEDRIAADLASGRALELVGELEGLVRQHALRERFTELLMVALHRSGRTTDALRVFSSLKRRLADEVGLEPSATLVALEERILLDDPDLRAPASAPSLTDSPGHGLSVRGYELRDRIGEGRAGVVYRGYQPSAGREVAIQVIRPELANDPTFIRRFEPDAHLLTRLEHPHIVPILDYWREPDAAFIVMRLLEGGSLAPLLEGDGLDDTARARLVEQVGSAISAAHQKGVAHGAITPSNILLDGEGNAYLSDFGAMAADGHSEEAVRADLEALVGLGRGLMDASVVFDRIEDVLAAVRGLSVTDRPGVTVGADVENPYRGLRAFGEEDAGRFFGRERLVERLVARLGSSGPQGRMVALVGPSGAGKSSVVRAGLIPALRAGALPGCDRWYVVTMKPGPYPFEALEEALLKVAVRPPAGLLERLTTDGLGSTVRAILPEDECQLVVVVDQLEELFSQASAPEAEAFLEALAAAARDRHAPVRIVATLRADFYDHPLRHRAFGELLRIGTEVITPMSSEELERAVVEPAAALGVEFQAGLVSEIISDSAGQSALPLLQYALTELFDRRRGALITADAYRELGGVPGALVGRADAILSGLSEEERVAARSVFVRLVTLGEGSEDTRRRARRDELLDVGGRRAEPVLAAFGRHRLLSFDRDASSRAPTVEIAHEAILTEWEQLRRWIDDARDDIRAQRRLAAVAQEWHDQGRPEGFLLSRARLERYAGWTVDPPMPLTAAERALLEASRGAVEAAASLEVRRVRRLRALVGAVGVALVVAVVAGVLAVTQRNEARAAADEAELATLISRSAALRGDDPDVALLLALEARRRSPGPVADAAVFNALGGSSAPNTIVTRSPLPGACVGFSIFWSQESGAREFDTIDGRVTSRDPLGGSVVDHGVPPAPCAVAYIDGAAKVGFAVEQGALRHWVGPEWDVSIEFQELALPLWVTEDRYFVLSGLDGGDEQSVALFDTSTGDPVGDRITGGVFLAMEVSSDDSVAALSFANPLDEEGDGRIFFVETATGDEITHLDAPDGAEALTFDPASGNFVAGFLGGTILSIDPFTGEVISTLTTGAFSFLDLSIRPEGSLFALSVSEIAAFDLASGNRMFTAGVNRSVDGWIRPDGFVVTLDASGQIEVVAPYGNPLFDAVWRVNPSSWVAFGAGQAAAVDAARGEVDLVDLETGDRALLDLADSEGTPFKALVVYPELDGVWGVSLDMVAARWVGDRLVAEVPLGSAEDVVGVREGRSVLGTRQGDYYAMVGRRSDGSYEASVTQLDEASKGPILSVETPQPLAVTPTLDGGLHVVDVNGMLRTYDPTGALVGEIDVGPVESVVLAVDPSTGIVGFAEWTGGLVLIDTVTSKKTVVSEEPVRNLGFGGDGRFLAFSLVDGSIRLWDVERAATVGLAWEGTGLLEGEAGWYDSTQGTLWMGSSGQLLGIPVQPEDWVHHACRTIGRTLTDSEWERLVPGDEPPRPACP